MIMIRLVVLLGNKGPLCSKTRHNSGWMFGDLLVSGQWQTKFNGQWGKFPVGNNTYYFLKPMTYMNVSGHSLSQMATYFNIKPDEILVVHDDLELPFLSAKLQQGGGLAGHNGLKSIVQHLKSDQFFRLRIGIGRPKHGSVSSFVLSKFTPDEQISIDPFFNKIKDQLLRWLDSNQSVSSLPLEIKG